MDKRKNNGGKRSGAGRPKNFIRIFINPENLATLEAYHHELFSETEKDHTSKSTIEDLAGGLLAGMLEDIRNRKAHT